MYIINTKNKECSLKISNLQQKINNENNIWKITKQQKILLSYQKKQNKEENLLSNLTKFSNHNSLQSKTENELFKIMNYEWQKFYNLDIICSK